MSAGLILNTGSAYIDVVGGPGSTTVTPFTTSLLDPTIVDGTPKEATFTFTGPGVLSFRVTGTLGTPTTVTDPLYSNVSSDSQEAIVTLNNIEIFHEIKNVSPFTAITTIDETHTFNITDNLPHTLSIWYARIFSGTEPFPNDDGVFGLSDLVFEPVLSDSPSTYDTNNWTWNNTAPNDTVPVVGHDGLTDINYNGAVLRKVRKVAGTALRFTKRDTNSIPVSALTEYGVNGDIAYVLTATGAVKVPLAIQHINQLRNEFWWANAYVLTLGDIVNSFNAKLHDSGLYCALEIVNTITAEIVFYAYDNLPTSLKIHIPTWPTLSANVPTVVDFGITAPLVSLVQLPVRDIWIPLSDDTNVTKDFRASSNGGEFPANSAVPTWSLGTKNNGPQKYCVPQNMWQRTGDFTRPPLDNNEIVNLRWDLSYENVHASTDQVYGDITPKILLTAIKAKPGVSMIDFNDPKFKPMFLCKSTTGHELIGGYIWIGREPDMGRITDPDNSWLWAHSGNDGGVSGKVITFVANTATGVINFAPIPNTEAQLYYHDHSGITVTSGSAVVMYTAPSGVEPWFTLGFNPKHLHTLKPFYPPAGVYNKTGLSNDVAYDFSLDIANIIGSDGIMGVRYAGSATTFITTAGGIGNTAGAPKTFTYTIPGNVDSYKEINFNIAGPGVCHVTANVTCNNNSNCRTIIEVTGDSYSTYNHAGNVSAYTHVVNLTDQSYNSIKLWTRNNTSNQTMTVSWSVYFAPTSIPVTPGDLTLSRENYSLHNTTYENPYDVTTIKGLIDAFNGIYGPNSNTTTEYYLKAGWSFDGKMVIQSMHRQQYFRPAGPMVLLPDHIDLFQTLANGNIEIETIETNTYVNNVETINPEDVNGITMAIPLVPKDIIEPSNTEWNPTVINTSG